MSYSGIIIEYSPIMIMGYIVGSKIGSEWDILVGWDFNLMGNCINSPGGISVMVPTRMTLFVQNTSSVISLSLQYMSGGIYNM